MYIKIRTGYSTEDVLIKISKTASVKYLKDLIKYELDIEPELQKLFFRGKQLENNYKLYDYNVNMNDVILLAVKATEEESKEEVLVSSSSTSSSTANSNKSGGEAGEKLKEERFDVSSSLYYKSGDAVDCLDFTQGAWFEAIILKVFEKDKKYVYNVHWEFDEKDTPFDVPETSIRPRATKLLQSEDWTIGQRVMINYNVDKPKEIGLWYDFTISNIHKKRKKCELTGTLHIGSDQPRCLENQTVMTKEGVYAIEEPKLLKDRTSEDEKRFTSNGTRRRTQASCEACLDNPHEDCKECGCKICAGKHDEHNLLLCDECNAGYHISCLTPPLTSIPEADYWYCPNCKNDENEIVKVGDKLKPSKRIIRTSTKDWGNGMACAKRSKECSIVDPPHRGPVPGIEVGMTWMFRLQVSEAGVHRPPVSGIHGRESDCAYSIVLSGGYEDDVDNGEEFIYTGSGGRDLSGNKRTAEQSCDQTLTRMNRALALNCNAELNEEGAIAKDWRKGIPVRVVRNYKLKDSIYAPKKGNRYDGIYKVVKYYPEKGKSGFRVWRYLLRRDDPAPAPWTKEGKKRIASLGLKLVYPDGYLEAMVKNKEQAGSSMKRAFDNDSEEENKKPANKKQKTGGNSEDEEPTSCYQLEDEVVKHIEADTVNQKLWAECREVVPKGKPVFLEKVFETFTCPCCLELVYKPITTPCRHNICIACIKRSFSSGVYCCPSCRYELDEDGNFVVNELLSSTLLLLYPGYGST
ncbi:E3 ubiquitin-protein ligase UHRF1-like [Ceratina calcarata]|uniref:RING-type E3 ubiquitin transferase n=1 Tax=Ceratina calcarata TaxID=156304 RepID=A0AAJ7WEE8_9HYME|nr:E3 ubiquitin-protein ligase UHRF1-like [Ceratina calcarata]XP_026673370.1 E3 ubiquitin-protein ligase UHRF1-like [Ceratina calcarata]XP_026673371.1 E3 ubiquitin-protein ligase UHRF1-like [Ceratina calcarata]XP_026673372.1 E3 ubiquitin-protein ligase UHRF1-like [Ceratina calcarata]XP_026673373.1 E3 ubiquitin-protein ligase UHRF1-like [Ceratina calcarata]